VTPADWSAFEDVELVLASLLGNLDAFDELAARYRPAIAAVARSIVGDAAEDVVQDVLLLAFKALPQLEDPSRFGAWVHAVTRHRALRVAERSARTEPRSEIDEALLRRSRVIAPSPVAVLILKEECDALLTAVEELDPDHRIVLRLCYWDEMPQQRIADFLGVPLTTVKWRLHKGKRVLYERLKPILGGD